MKDSARALEELYPAPEAASVVRILVEDLLGVTNTRLMSDPMRALSASEESLLRSCMERLLASEPVQYVTGRAWFYGRAFSVNPSVLIPRQETELLVDEAVRLAKSRSVPAPRVLDLCTGSGCIAWSLAAEIPGARVTAVDISEAALELAGSQDICVPAQPVFIKADVLNGNSLRELPGGPFDILLSNPPYVRDSERSQMRANVLDHEPALALFVSDEDPLKFYRAIAEYAPSALSAGGFGIVEINEAFAPQVEALFVAQGFRNVRTIVDFFGKDRHVFFEK